MNNDVRSGMPTIADSWTVSPKHYIDTEIMGKYGSNFDGRPVYQEYWAEEMVCEYPLEAKYGYPVILGIDTTGLNPAVAFGQLEMGCCKSNMSCWR